MEDNFELPDDIKRTLLKYYSNENFEKVLEKGSESQNKRRQHTRSDLFKNIENSANIAQKKRRYKNLNLRKIVIDKNADIDNDDTIYEQSPMPLIDDVKKNDSPQSSHGKKYNPSYIPEHISEEDVKKNLFKDFILTNIESWEELLNHDFNSVENISHTNFVNSIKKILNIFAVVSVINSSIYKEFYENVKKAYPELKKDLTDYNDSKKLLEKHKNEWFENGLVLSETDKNVFQHILDKNL